jgi:hypothetical protein
MLHPIRRIGTLNRGNLVAVRQIESAVTFRLLARPIIGHTAPHEQTRPDACPDLCSVHGVRRGEERRRLYHSQPWRLRSNRAAASDSGHRSLRTFLLVKCERPLDNLWHHGAHETHARKCSRDHRERSDVSDLAAPMTQQNWPKSTLACDTWSTFVATAALLPTLDRS